MNFSSLYMLMLLMIVYIVSMIINNDEGIPQNGCVWAGFFFFEEETSFEKIPPSNLYVGKSTGHFLD